MPVDSRTPPSKLDKPRVLVNPPFGEVYEAVLLTEGEQCTVRRLDGTGTETVRHTQLWRNGFDAQNHPTTLP